VRTGYNKGVEWTRTRDEEPAMNATPKTTATLEDLKARMQAIGEELETMPTSKLGTQWHADRCTEVRSLAKRLEMMVG
jgi:hypothetical protein